MSASKTPPHGDPLRPFVLPGKGITEELDEIARDLEDACGYCGGTGSKEKGAESFKPRNPTPRTDAPYHGFRIVERGQEFRAIEDSHAVPEFAPVLKRSKPRFDGYVRPVTISVAYNNDVYGMRDAAREVQEIVALATHGEIVPRDAGLTFGYGVGSWGLESCVHINTCSPVDPTHFIYLLLLAFKQTCAYVEVDGLGWEVQDSEWNPITGVAS